MKNLFKCKLFLLIIALFQTFQSHIYAQHNTLDEKCAILYSKKVYGTSVVSDYFFESYLKLTKPGEFQSYKNDEFNYSKFFNSNKTEFINDLASLDFTKRYTINKIADIGVYNFQSKSFPILINYTNFFGQLNPTIRPNDFSVTAEVFNSAYIKKELFMSEAEADALIQRKKNPNGIINRKFLIKIDYSVMNLRSEVNTDNIVLYVHKISIYDESGLIQSITPNEDYYDKVNGLKLKDGQDKIFFDSKWNELPKESSSGASFYRIVNYKDGKIVNPVIDYYITGIKQMMGNYSVNLQTKNGSFEWFYENGQISRQSMYDNNVLKGLSQYWHPNGNIAQAVNYVADKKDGLYNSWYPDGSKKEEVNYIADKKDGCDYSWAENGKCLRSSILNDWRYTDSYFAYFSYYEKGVEIEKSKSCPCRERASNSQNVAANNTKLTPQIEFVGFFNDDMPIGDYVLFGKNVYYKARGLEITEIAVEDINRNPITDSRVKLGNPIFLKIKIKRLNQEHGKFQYILANYVEDKDGIVYSSESANQEIYNESSWISIAGGIRKMLSYSATKETYMSFKIQDRNSDAIVQGFLIFTVFQ